MEELQNTDICDRADRVFSNGQARIIDALRAHEQRVDFDERLLEDARSKARPKVLEDGDHFERAVVNFTRSRGTNLPCAATKKRPELAGAPFEAVSLSVIVHPQSPHVPTAHMNVRVFAVRAEACRAFWLGGGFDLTPYFPVMEDVVHWHRVARRCLERFGADLYPRMKADCDAYFHLPHRGETRGVGGIIFDDFQLETAGETLGFAEAIIDAFLSGYMAIVLRRMHEPYGERERDFQLYRRGRYVEFNLMYDRGTRYGVESGRRIESVLASLPPLASYRYDYGPEPGSAEAELTAYLRPRDWLAEAGGETC